MTGRSSPAVSLRGFQAWRLLAVPRPAEEVQAAKSMAAGVQGAVTAAHARLLGAGEPRPALLSAWMRLPGCDSMRFALGGRPVFPAARPGSGEGPVRLLYPPGVSAEAFDLADALGRFSSWVRCLGSVALPDDEAAAKQADRRADDSSRFDDYVAHLPFPFAWMIVAEPVAPKILDDEAARLAAELT